MKASGRAGVLTTLVVFALLALTQVAQAATTITRAELRGTDVRIEGTGAVPNARLVVNGGVLTGTADGAGNFRIERTGFTAPADCRVTVTVPPSVTVPGGSTRASFAVTTMELTNAQSAVIIGTVGGDFSTERHAIITVWDPFHFSHGTVGVFAGGTGSGRVTSQPAGVDCVFVDGNGSGTCSTFFDVGTVVRLDARAADNSKFLGFRAVPGCPDASKIVVARGTRHICQVVFQLK